MEGGWKEGRKDGSTYLPTEYPVMKHEKRVPGKEINLCEIRLAAIISINKIILGKYLPKNL